MAVEIGNVFLLSANAVITFVCGGVLLYFIYAERVKKHFLYYFWALGFIMYGIEITTRVLLVTKFLSLDVNLFGAFMICAFVFFPIGLWSVSRRKRIFYILATIYTVMFTLYGLFVLDMLPYEFFVRAFPFFLYLPVTVTLLDHRFIFGKSLDRIIIGWFLLFLSNLFLIEIEWIVDVFAIFAKFIILLGIMNYDFVILIKGIQKELVPHLPPPDAGCTKEGGLRLIISPSSSIPQRKADWIDKKAKENTNRDTNTYIFSFQNVIPYSMLRRIKWVNPKKIFVFVFSTSAEKAREEFAVLPMGITHVGAALSEVIRKNPNPEEGCTVIFMDLSLLIHSFGVYPVYNMLLSKMGSLREGRVDLFAFFHPETHSDKSVVSLFTNIADDVIKL